MCPEFIPPDLHYTCLWLNGTALVVVQSVLPQSSHSARSYSASSSSYSSDLSVDDSFAPEFRSDSFLADKMVAWSGSCGRNKVVDSSADDIIIDVDNKSLGANFDKLDFAEQ